VLFRSFPAYASKNLGNPVLGAGTVWGITNDSPEAHALMTYLQSTEANEIWMARKGFLTPHKGVDTSKFSDPTLRKMNDILLNATTFRFDASDLMPGGVGAGSFWTGMVDYSGGKPAKDVADGIQASWDSLK
jgi:alpha-glucoside transport system substrate-binding protein